jgi:hypothetical protein
MSAKTQLFVGTVRHHAMLITTMAWLFYVWKGKNCPERVAHLLLRTWSNANVYLARLP